MSEKSLFEIVGTQKPAREKGVLWGGPAEVATPSPDAAIAAGVARRAWAEADGTFWGTPQSHDRMPVGLYRMAVMQNIGPAFLRQQNDTDSLVELPDSESSKVVDEIRAFKGLKEAFQAHGFLYKRGILLWGPPGSGKTCTLQMIVKMLMGEHGSIAVLVEHPQIAATCLQALRRIEPERQIVALLEDMDSLCQQYEESAFLALLDGESQVDNIIFVATTNYPERLDKRFVDRPSRFDTVRYIGMPSAEARSTYLKAKVPDLSELALHEYVKLSDGYSIAHLREFIILTRCFGMPIKDAAKRLDGTRSSPPSSERAPDRAAFGFGSL
jgi:hypothetical protein